MSVRTASIFFVSAACAVFADLPGGALGNGGGNAVFNRRNLEFLEFKFGDALERAGARAGAVCAAEAGKVVLEKTIEISSAGRNSRLPGARRFPLGKSSAALVSLLAAAMENAGKLNASSPAAGRCSFFRSFRENADDATFSDLVSCAAGIPPKADALIPDECSSAEFFQVLAQIPPCAPPGGERVQSLSSVAAAGYALGYVENPSEPDMKKSFASAAKKYLFSPLGIRARYRSFDKAYFPAAAFSLSCADAAKWLAQETSPSPAVADKRRIESRRRAYAKGEFGGGFVRAYTGGKSVFVCSDYFENTANLIAVFPEMETAAAFFVDCPDAKRASELCGEMLAETADMAGNPSGRDLSPGLADKGEKRK